MEYFCSVPQWSEFPVVSLHADQIYRQTKTKKSSHDTRPSTSQCRRLCFIINADISRTGANSNCNHCFCRNGPDQAGGYTWKINLATSVGNVSPFSPTSSQYDSVRIIEDLIVHNHLTGCTEMECTKVEVDLDTCLGLIRMETNQ